MGLIYTSDGRPVTDQNPLPVMLSGATLSAMAEADNAPAEVSLPAPPPGQAHYVWGIVAGYSGSAAGRVEVYDGGDLVEAFPVHNVVHDLRVRPMKVAGGLRVVLSASGTLGVVGTVVVRYETR